MRVITLQREEKLTALSTALEGELLAALAEDAVRKEPQRRTRGSRQAFSAGADINEFRDAEIRSVTRLP